MILLELIVTGQWYDMIERGDKKEEYRTLSNHWVSRIWYNKDKIKAIRFHRGYTNTTMTLKCEGITIGKGNPQWGAPEEEVLILKLGEKV